MTRWTTWPNARDDPQDVGEGDCERGGEDFPIRTGEVLPRGGRRNGEGAEYHGSIPETCRSRALCHIEYPVVMLGHWKVFPERSISLIKVSIGVFPTNLTKNSCSITEADTVLKEGRRRRSLPNLVGWLGYWVLQYSSRAHWDFSCNCSITGGEVRPIASENKIAWVYTFYIIHLYIFINGLQPNKPLLQSTYCIYHKKT